MPAMPNIFDSDQSASVKASAFLAGLATAVWTLVGTALMLLTGWLSDVANWISSDSESVAFPSMDPLAKVGVALGLALVVGGLNWAWRWAQSNPLLSRFVPGRPVSYEPRTTPEV